LSKSRGLMADLQTSDGWASIKAMQVANTEDDDDRAASPLDMFLRAHGISNDLVKKIGADKDGAHNLRELQSPIRRWCFGVCSNAKFMFCCLFMTLGYTVVLGLKANFVAEHGLERALQQDDWSKFFVAEIVFTCWFIFEVVLQFIALKSVKVTDILVISALVVQIFLLIPAPFQRMSAEARVLVSTLLCVGLLRITRVIAIIKFLRGFKLTESLYLMIQSIHFGLTSLGFILVMLAMYVAIFAILLSSIIGSNSVFESSPPLDDFHNFSVACVTLLGALLGGTQWDTSILRPMLNSKDPATNVSGVVFFIYITLGQVCLMHLVTAVFIEMIISAEKNHTEFNETATLLYGDAGVEHLTAIFDAMDRDGDGMLSWDELAVGLTEQQLNLSNLGVSMEVAQLLYKQLANANNGKVTVSDYLFGWLRATKGVHTLDMLVIEYEQYKAVRDLQQMVSWCRDDVDEIKQTMLTHLKSVSHKVESYNRMCAVLDNRFNLRRYAKTLMNVEGPDGTAAQELHHTLEKMGTNEHKSPRHRLTAQQSVKRRAPNWKQLAEKVSLREAAPEAPNGTGTEAWFSGFEAECRPLVRGAIWQFRASSAQVSASPPSRSAPKQTEAPQLPTFPPGGAPPLAPAIGPAVSGTLPMRHGPYTGPSLLSSALQPSTGAMPPVRSSPSYRGLL